MTADGVEADMNFRDGATPEIRRREMMGDRRQARGRGANRSASHFTTLITFIVCLFLTPQTADASRKVYKYHLCACLNTRKQNNDNENKESYFCDAEPSRAH